MNISLPGIEHTLTEIMMLMRCVAYALLVVGFMQAANRGEGSMKKVGGELLKLTAIAVGIAYFPNIFSEIQDFFWDIAEMLVPGFKDHIFKTSAQIIDETTQNKKGILKSLFGDGVYESLSLALAQLIIKMVALLIIPFMWLQYLILQLGKIIAPVFLALVIFPSMLSRVMNFASEILSVMAWPVGFALTSLIASRILQDFSDEKSGAQGVWLESNTVMGNMGAALLASLVMLIGLCATPKIMKTLFSSGTGLADLGEEAKKIATMGSGSPGTLMMRTVSGLGLLDRGGPWRGSRVTQGSSSPPPQGSSSAPQERRVFAITSSDREVRALIDRSSIPRGKTSDV